MFIPDLAHLRDIARPFRVGLTMRFRGVTYREGLLFEGPSGWAEFAPFDDYAARGASRWLAAALEQGWGSWPDPVRESVPVNAIIPAVDVAATEQLVADALARGCTTMKVKVAGEESSQADDIARLRTVRDVLTVARVQDARIRIDVNTGWSVDDARDLLPALVNAAEGLEYVEQPCATLEECAKVRAMKIAPVAVDEGIRLADDLTDSQTLRAITSAADVVILKPIPLGGVAALLQLAERLQKPAVVSSSMDTSVGLAAGIAAAAALPQLEHACGLGTGALLAEDVCEQVVLPAGGGLSPLRPQVDESALQAYAIRAEDPRCKYWTDRLTDCCALLRG